MPTTKSAKHVIRKLRTRTVLGFSEVGTTSVVVTFEERFSGQYTPHEFNERFEARVSNVHDALRKTYPASNIRITARRHQRFHS